MPVYLIIEERDGDELVSFAKYDTTEPAAPSILQLPDGSILQVARGESLAHYLRRIDPDPRWLEPCVDLGAKAVPREQREGD
jgi:hypothetical protein